MKSEDLGTIIRMPRKFLKEIVFENSHFLGTKHSFSSYKDFEKEYFVQRG
jgi:hypothetical protein